MLAVLAALGLTVSLPGQMGIPAAAAGVLRIAVPAAELALLLPLAVTTPHRHAHESRARRSAAVALTAGLSAANVLALALLVAHLAHGGSGGAPLLLAAGQVWATNVIVFALWYWELDGGGPPRRLADPGAPRDFAFVQMLSPEVAEAGWHPRFADYLYLSFTASSSFSASDTLPLTRWAKLLLMLQSAVSIVIVVLVAARAVNMLG